MKRVVLALSVLVALALSFHAGRLSVRYAGGKSAADVLPAGAGACYLDPQAGARLSEFAWEPPFVPTPFVNFAPRPGKFLNAFVTPLQLRAERDPVVPKPAGRLRVLLVGGSVAFGSGAPSQDRTVAAYLERGLGGRAEVFTLACPWWTSTHERIAIEQRAAALEVDVVVVLTGFNDIWQALHRVDVRWMRAPVDRFYFEASGQPEFVALDAAVPDPKTVGARFKGNMLPAPAVRYALQPCLHGSKKPLTDREKELLARSDPSTVDYVTRCYGELRALLGVTDVSDSFDATREDVFLDTVHCADRGNELVARRILDRIGF